MGINLTSIARIQSSVQDRNQASRPYSVFWAENGDLQDWTTFVDLDIVGAWNGFLFGTKRTPSSGFIQPTDDFAPVDTLINDRIFFRMRYDKHSKNSNTTSLGKIQWTTTADALFSSDRELTFPLTPDQGFKLYELDMNQSRNWTGFVTNIRFFPCIDGAINDEFFLNFFEIGTNKFDFDLDNPSAGAPARLIGSEVLTNDITITKDVNDSLFVNLDGYGFVNVRLTPQTTSPSIIARDLSIQLSKVALGGYVRANAFVDPLTQRFVIESGTRASNSSVQIQIKPKTAAAVLGLATPDGIITATSTSGSEPLPTFTSISDYKPTTFELLNFLDSSHSDTAFTLSPNIVVVEGGRRDFGTVTKSLNTEVVIEGRSTELESTKITVSGTFGNTGRTFIDLNHPFTDEGKLRTISFNGSADEDGGSKWKIFRPLQNGNLTLVSEGIIGERTIVDNPNNGLVLTTEPGVYTQDVSGSDVRVRRGDLLGIYNVSMHLGTGRTAKPDALFYEIVGDAVGTITPSVPSGAGDGGIPIYAVGSSRRNQTVLDIDLGKRINLDTITIFGEEANNDLEYNVSTASSANFSVDVKGEYTICRIIDFVFFARACFTRPNQAFNIQALNDGVRFADNGISSFGSPGEGGVGGATVEGATYFYINGDSEFLGVHDLQGTDPKSYGFERDPFGLTCFFSSSTPRLDKSISRVVMYFKDPKNMRSWQIETARGQGDAGGNGSINGFDIIPAEKILAIEFDNKRVAKDLLIFTQKNTATQNILLGNPVILDVVTKTGVRNPQKGVDFRLTPRELGGVNFADQATFVNVQWSKFQWEFDPIRTTGFRWFCDYHFSSKISEVEIYASAPALESLADNVQVLFSADGENFATAEIVNGTTTSAEFQLGHSPRFLRLILRPSREFFAKRLSLNFEQDQILFGDNGRILGTTNIDDARVGSVGQASVVPVINNTGKVADLIVDIPEEGSPSKELLYFSHLNSQEDIILPQIGGSGRINFDEDKPLLETENVAINAKSYGLRNLVTSTDVQSSTNNLIPNGGFETGDLSGWKLTVLQSGTKIFQSPQVYDPSAEGSLLEPSIYTADGTFSFGFSMDSRVPEQLNNFVPIEFILETDPIDLAELSASIDLGGGEIISSFKYVAAFEPEAEGPVLSFITSPTVSGISAPPGSIVSPEYGSNLARQKILRQADRADIISATGDIITIQDFRASLKPGTRFLKIRFDVKALSQRFVISTLFSQKFFLDSVDVQLSLTNPAAVRWYKSWRLGQGDFTDANFVPITEFSQTVGSHHWWQPFKLNANNGVPVVGQTQGFSNAFASDRTLGIQAFSRVTQSDPGTLGCKWDGEKRLAGFRVGLGHNPGSFFAGALFNVCGWPRFWFVDVLKTQEELGEEPDLNNPNHFRLVTTYERTGPWARPEELTTTGDTTLVTSPAALLTTWLFEEPIITQGLRLSFTLSCDRFEQLVYGTTLTGSLFTTFTNNTTCPDNLAFETGFDCDYGASVTFLQPLEAAGRTVLPVDNVKETLASGTNNVYAAVDLRRLHAVDTNSKVFELIVDSRNETDWLSSNVIFSNSATDDPNQVVWGNASAQSARWIRFSSAATEKYEDTLSVEKTSDSSVDVYAVETIPQSSIQSARIYPDVTVEEIFTVGPNCQWDALDNIVSDNNNATFINYSDYPIIAMDLGDTFILESTSTAFRPIHDVITIRPTSIGDKIFWDAFKNENFTYSNGNFRAVSDPRKVKFRTFGSSAPVTSVRWVALRGDKNLRSGVAISSTFPSREYLFRSGSGKLFQSTWRPKVQDPITDHPSWFSTKRSGLRDVSSIKSTLGNTFAEVEGIDYGASKSNLGSSYFPFDNRFSTVLGDIWGVQVRNDQGVIDPLFNFPHKLFRVFRDTFTGNILSKKIVAFKILGYNDIFHPKDFKLQSLKPTISIATTTDATTNAANIEILSQDSSWQDVLNTSFTDVNTYQDGAGFTFILDNPVTARGFRLFVINSEYPDDSVLTGVNDAGGFSTIVDASGPQTRLIEFVLYEEDLIESTLQGIININHSLGATFSATSEVSVNPIANLSDGDLSTFWQSRGLRETVNVTFSSPRPISKFEWIKDPNLGRASGGLSTNAPQDFTLTALIPGQQPLTVLSQTNFTGTTFSGTLEGAPINTDKFVFEITKVQGEAEDASSIQISELRLIEQVLQIEPLIVIGDVLEGPNTNAQSTKIEYAANTDAPAAVHVDGMDAGSDVLFSERDFFEFQLKINDINLFDKNYGHIKLGNSREISYRWDIKNIPNLISGWNKIKLQFQSANSRAVKATEGGPNFELQPDLSQVDFTKEDVEFTSAVDGNVSQRVIQAPGIRFFEIEFRGTKAVPDKKLELLLNGFQFTRNRFDDVCKFNAGLYLNNSEVLQIPIENIDISSGTVEFWFQPDWDFNGIVRSRGRFIPSFFRVSQPDGKFLNFFYRPGTGFVLLIFDGEQVRQFETVITQHPFSRFETFHLAVVWDVGSNIGRSKTTAEIFFNGRPIFGTKVKWKAVKQGRGNFVVGGEFSQTLVANPFNSTALAFTTVPTLPARHTASTWGLIENLKVYNFPKVDFSDRFDFDVKRGNLIGANEMIEVSLDGINFERSGSKDLPLIQENVPPDQKTNIYVRTNIPKDLTGEESRDASILVTWRAPRSKCN